MISQLRQSSSPRIIRADQPVRGVAILVAGLNNRPDVLDPLARSLAAVGVESVVVTLLGHADAAQGWPRADFFSAWRADIEAAREFAHKHYQGQPIYGVGYSLGATLLLDAISNSRLPSFSKLAVIAPAVTLTNKTQLLRPLLPLGILGLTLPSFAPPQFQAQPRTGIRAYRGMFAAAQSVRTPNALLQATPLLVLATPFDELVDYSDLREWSAQSKRWHFVSIELSSPPKLGYYHLLFDRENIGESAWQKLTEEIVSLVSAE